MSKLMRDWIRPAVRKQLEEILGSATKDGKISESSSQDGAFIKHITTAAAVQVNEFTNHDPPYQLLLSDSYTQIRAIFTRSCTDIFQKQHKQLFSKSINGAVLAIIDCNLKIMLKINNFNLQGSEGSANFGDPIPVEMADAVKALMSRLEMNLKEGESDQPTQLNPTSPVQSQAEFPVHNSSFPEKFMEPEFSTQAPSRFQSGTSLRRQTASASSSEALLAALQRNNTRNQHASNGKFKLTRTSNSPRSPKTHEKLANGNSNLALSPSESRQHSATPLASNVQSIEPLSGSTKKYDDVFDNVQLSQAASRTGILGSERTGSKECGVIDDGFLSPKITSKDGLVSIRGVHDEPDMSLRNPCTTRKPGPTIDNASHAIQDISNPWAGLTRIPHKYVQVAKDQQAVLEHDDAWFPKAPSDGQPSINLPQNILTSLQAFHNGLVNILRNGQTHSDSDNEDEFHSEDHKDSGSEHSENEKCHVLRQSRSACKARSISISSQRDYAPDLSETTLNGRGDSSAGACLGFAETDADHEIGLTNVEGFHIEPDKNIANGEILLDTGTVLSSASSDDGDETSIDEQVSWSSSPSRVEVPSASNYSLLGEMEETVDDCQSIRPNKFQLYPKSHQNLALTSVNAELPFMRENDADLAEGSFSALHSKAEQQTIRATPCKAHTISTAVKNSSGIFSSSPVEMELSVPHALGNQSQPTDGTAVTDVFNADRPKLSTSEQHPLMFNLETTPNSLSRSGSLQENAHSETSDMSPNLIYQKINTSSDPIIPGTFRSDISDTLTRPEKLASFEPERGLGSNIFGSCQVISATAYHSTHTRSYALPQTNDKSYLVRKAEIPDAETQMQKSRTAESTIHAYSSVVSVSEVVGGRQQYQHRDDIKISSAANNQRASQQSILGSQILSFEPLPPFPFSPRVDEVSLSSLATPIKRRVSDMQDIIEHSPKRRRTLQAVIFGSAPETDSVVDPTEMAKANRHKFLQELSLSSLVPSPHAVYVNSTAQLSMAPTAVLATLIKKEPSRNSTTTCRNNISPTVPLQGQQRGYSKYLEKLVTENLDNVSLDHSEHNARMLDSKDSSSRCHDNGNIRAESIDSRPEKTRKILNFNSAEASPRNPYEYSSLATELESGNAHASLSEDVFTTFKRTYPSYRESLRAFIRACVCLDWLQSVKKAPHPSLWDDFIRAFSTEYLIHVEESRLSGRKPMSAPEFYNDQIPEPIFTGRIITLARLHEAFLLDPEEAAKVHAKVNRKDTKTQEPISIGDSQTTLKSKILAESQDVAKRLFGNSFSNHQLPSPSEGTSRRASDDAGDAGMAPNHLPDAISVTSAKNSLKTPFFETPSQFVTEARHIESPRWNTPILAEVRNNGVVKDLSEYAEFPEVKIGQTDVSEQFPRQTFSSLSPSKKPNSEELKRVDKAILEWSDTSSDGRKPLQQPVLSSLRERKGSPILGNWRTSHCDIPLHSRQVASAQAPFLPKTTATFKDFSKAFVPRQKRRSSAFSRVSTPSSDASPSR